MYKDRFKRLMSKMSDADYDEAASQAATNMPPEQLYNYFSGPAEDVRYGGAGPEELTLPNSSYQKFNKSLNNLINEEGWDD
jgi:hypothetical protein